MPCSNHDGGGGQTTKPRTQQTTTRTAGEGDVTTEAWADDCLISQAGRPG